MSIYATTATSRPAKTPMATPLTLFLLAALDSLDVGLDEVLDKVSLDEDPDWLDEVDSALLLDLKNTINMRSRDML